MAPKSTIVRRRSTTHILATRRESKRSPCHRARTMACAVQKVNGLGMGKTTVVGGIRSAPVG